MAGSAAIISSDDGSSVAFDAVKEHGDNSGDVQSSGLSDDSRGGSCIKLEYLGAVRRFILYVRVEEYRTKSQRTGRQI